MEVEQGNWDEWRNHVLIELRRQNDCNERLSEDIQEVQQTVSTLSSELSELRGQFKARSSVYGVLGGAGVTLLSILSYLVKRLLGGQ